MSRFALLFLLLLSACSGAGQGPPRDIENACAIKRDRPSWYRDMVASERKWGAPVHVQMATLYQESTFRPNAKTPRKFFLGFIPNGRVSSAYGYSQAINSTWDWYKRDTGRRSAKRNRFSDASDFMGWYMSQTATRNNVAFGDAYNQYLAYHEGHTGFARKSFNRKRWLLSTAKKVDARAQTYQQQLASCT